MSKLAEFFSGLEGKTPTKNAKKMGASYRIYTVIEDTPKEAWDIDMTGDTIKVVYYHDSGKLPDDAEVGINIWATDKDIEDLIDKKKDVHTAFLTSKLKLQGDMHLVIRMEEFLLNV
jgi:putative sterol carrier protein